MFSKSRNENDGASDDGENDVTKNGEEKNVFFEFKHVALHYTREVGSMTTGTLSRGAHHINVCEKTVHF